MIGSLLSDPRNFLHSIDVDGNQAIFFRTDAKILREASFVDGRLPIATEAASPAPLSEMIAQNSHDVARERYLFNCSFCGSTLLARLLDVPGRSLVLKEPRVLTDIAAWKIFNRRDGLSIDQLRPTLALARTALRRRFSPREKVTVKVASQGNVLLSTLAEDSAQVRPVFITISRASFLRAIFRGGTERMHYAATIAWHMATDEADGDRLLKEAVSAGADPLRKAANLAILARYFQVGAFRRAAAIGGWNDNHVIDFDQINREPRAATAKAVAALDLSINDNDIDRNVARLSGRYAKQPDLAFSAERQQSADRAALADHRQVFDDALAWANITLGPQLCVAD